MEISAFEKRKRIFLLAAPLLFLPFVALLFYALGGGRGGGLPAQEAGNGLNTSLPSPQVNAASGMDKLSLYQQADKDSMNRIHARSEEAAFDTDKDRQVSAADTSSRSEGRKGLNSRLSASENAGPNNEEKVTRKLAQLQQLLAAKAADTVASKRPLPPEDAPNSLEALTAMKAAVSPPDPDAAEVDPQLKQMDGMLDKILDIQHPARIQQKLADRSAAHKEQVFAVTSQPDEAVDELVGSTGISHPLATIGADTTDHQVTVAGKTAFYELDAENGTSASPNTISAVIHEGKTIVSGASIKIRLQQDIYVQGQLIAKGSLLFGKCSFSGDRLQIHISAIPFEGNLFPVNLSVYDTFGMEGIAIDASLNQEAAQDASQEAIQTLGLSTLDPSVAAQAASAGIEAAKRMLTKKIRTVKVTLKTDFPILLVDPKGL